jgi:hypothetical protein
MRKIRTAKALFVKDSPYKPQSCSQQEDVLSQTQAQGIQIDGSY